MAKVTSSKAKKARSTKSRKAIRAHRRKAATPRSPKVNKTNVPSSKNKAEKPAIPPLPERAIAETSVNGSHPVNGRLLQSDSGFDLQERLRELVKLAKEQGYLTYDDINEALPEGMADPDEMEQILGRLRSMEVEIIDASEVDRFKDGKKDLDDEDDEKDQKLDILDDPVRMYLKQMGQVPLLTREQEVEISKRIENAELKAQEALFQASAVGGYIAVLGAKLLNREERFDRIVIGKKIESRDAYFRTLPKLVESTQKAEAGTKEAWIEQSKARSEPERKKALSKFRRRGTAPRANFSKFFFKLKVYEEYLEQLRPVLEELEVLKHQLDRAKHPKTKKDAAIDTRSINNKLRHIE